MSGAVILRPLCAADELEALRRFPRLIPHLSGMGLDFRDAAALACNATVLSYALDGPDKPRTALEVLRRFSLAEIAELCERLDSGAQEESGFDFDFDKGEGQA